MPDKTDRLAETGFNPLIGLEAMMELNRPALATMAQMNGRVYESLAEMNKSWADFVNRRLKQDLGVPQQLAACKSVQDVYGLYADYLQAAVSDYRAELDEMSKLGKTLADDTMQAMRAHAEESAREASSSK